MGPVAGGTTNNDDVKADCFIGVIMLFLEY